MTWFRPFALALVPALLAACASAEPATEPTATTRVVVTTSVLGDITRSVLDGTGAEVEVLLPPGVDPHSYAPSASDGVTLREADLVVANGLQLEEPLLDTLDAAAADGVRVLEVAEDVDPLPVGEATDHGDEEPADHDDEAEDEAGDDEGHGAEDDGDHDDDHGSLDPHVWLDPIRVGEIADVVAEAFAQISPDDEATVTANADGYVDTMTALDEELRAMVDQLESRQVVTNHDALGYLADRYDLEVVGTVIPGTSTDVDVTAERFTQLVETIEQTGVPAIFVDTSASDRLARALAQEVGDVEVVELFTGSLGEAGSGADTVPGMIRTNVERIVAALG